MYSQTFEFNSKVTRKMTSSNERNFDVESFCELINQRFSMLHYNDLRLTKLGFHLRLARAINMIGANGISLFLWGAFYAFWILATKMRWFFDNLAEDTTQLLGVVLLIISTIYLIMFIFMVKQNKQKNLSGVTNSLKLICSFTGVIMLSTCLGTILLIILNYGHYGFKPIKFSLPFIVIYTIIIIKLIYGITNGKKWHVARFIAFALPGFGILMPVMLWTIVGVGIGDFDWDWLFTKYVLVPSTLIILIIIFLFLGVFIVFHSILDLDQSWRRGN